MKNKKNEMHEFNMKIKMKIQLTIIFMHISSSISFCVFYFFRTEENLVATSGIQNIRVANSIISWID